MAQTYNPNYVEGENRRMIVQSWLQAKVTISEKYLKPNGIGVRLK
jgi:hypothetical protein